MSKSGVYLIRNRITGLIYVGATRDLAARWFEHKKLLASGKHPSRRLQRAFVEAALSMFEFEVLEEVPDLAHLRGREQAHLDNLRPYDPANGYNTHLSAISPKGVKRSAKTRAKMSKSALERDPPEGWGEAISRGRRNSDKAKAAVKALNAAKRGLTPDEVLKVVARRAEGASQDAIANELKVSRRVVRAILSGETYTEITGLTPP